MKFINFLTYLFLINISCQTVTLPPGSHEFFITEIVRVKRQAGYVYNTPNIPFDLPTQIATVPTQAPNVDRTQAQHMFYAYPAPAPDGTSNTGYAASGQTTTAINTSGSGGYNYGAQSAATGGLQTTGSTQNQNVAIGQGATGSSGYGYNAPGNIDNGGQSINSGATQTSSSSASTATSSVSSSYRYDAPSSGVQVEDSGSTGSVQTSYQESNLGKSQSKAGSLAPGYDYNGPVQLLSNNVQSLGTFQTDSGSSQPSGTTSGYSSSISESPNTGQITSGTRPSQSATSSVNSSYRYDTPVSSNIGQLSTFSASSQSESEPVSQGYNYNNHVQPVSNIGQTSFDASQITTNSGNTQDITSSDISGYNINAPSLTLLSTGQGTRSSTAPQTSTISNTATSSVSTSYRYENPRQTGPNQSFGVTINVPKYLPPRIEGNIEVNNKGSSGTTIDSAKQPLGSYIPPQMSIPTDPKPVNPSDTYIPPTSNAPTELTENCIGPECGGYSVSKPSPVYVASPMSGPSGSSTELSSHSSSSSSYNPNNFKLSNPTITQPSNSYIPPTVSQPSGFVAVQPSSAYIPSTNSGGSQTTGTKPGPNYLLPQGSRGPATPRSTATRPSHSYITPPNSVENNQPVNSLPTTTGYHQPAAAPTPNANYLPPNTVSPTISNTNEQNNDYLPPRQSSFSQQQQGAVSIPATSYLPPVF